MVQAWYAPVWAWLHTPMSILPLVWYRVTLGIILVWEAARYLRHGWAATLFTPPVRLHYVGFGWVPRLPTEGVVWLFVLLGGLGVCVLLGAWPRLAAGLYAGGFVWAFFHEATNYLNHHYLTILLAALLALLPCGAALSVDACLAPQLRRRAVPRWAVGAPWLLLALVYTYAAGAKLNPDWLAGQPMTLWLERRSHLPTVRALLALPAAGLLMSWGGLLIDLLAAPALLWRAARWPMLAALVAFHALNSQVFGIGVFPWMMLVLTPLLLPGPLHRAGLRLLPPTQHDGALPRRPSVGLVLVGVFLAVQLVLPLRAWLYPSDVAWSEEGHRFAWRMKLRDKHAITTQFYARQVGGRSWVALEATDVLSARQARQLSGRPDLLVQTAHALAARSAAYGVPLAEVRAWAEVSLNGHPPRLLLDPHVNLLDVTLGAGQAWWVLPRDDPRSDPARARASFAPVQPATPADDEAAIAG